MSNLSNTYKGFSFDYEQGFVTFYHPDLEEGNGDWSGSASTLEDAYEMIDEMTFEDNWKKPLRFNPASPILLPCPTLLHCFPSLSEPLPTSAL